MLYWITVPAIACMALMPFGRSVFDLLYPALACPVLGLAVMLPMAIGFRSRRYWGVVLFHYGAIAAIALLALSLLAIAVVLAATFASPPAMIGITWAAGAILLPLAALVPFPLRALRLDYWRPAAERAAWETGDERIRPRVARALGGRR